MIIDHDWGEGEDQDEDQNRYQDINNALKRKIFIRKIFIRNAM